jgi:hypothetical protein
MGSVFAACVGVITNKIFEIDYRGDNTGGGGKSVYFLKKYRDKSRLIPTNRPHQRSDLNLKLRTSDIQPLNRRSGLNPYTNVVA